MGTRGRPKKPRGLDGNILSTKERDTAIRKGKPKEPLKDENGKSICGAKTRNGGMCQKPPIVGRTRCRNHGGMSLQGADNPHYKTGRYSKYMPDKLWERFQLMKDDPNIIDLRENIALLDVRLEQLVERTGEGDFGKGWVTIRRLYDKIQSAIKNGDTDQVKPLLDDMGDIIHSGENEYKTWKEITEVNEKRVATAKIHQDIVHKQENAIAMDDFMQMVERVLYTLKEEIQDTIMLNRVSGRLAQAFGLTIPVVRSEVILYADDTTSSS